MQIKHIFFVLILTMISVNSQTLEPEYNIRVDGGVSDLVYNNNKLYIATVASSINIFDIKSKELIYTIKLPKIKDFIGDDVDSKIYSIDVLNDIVLIVSQGNKGGRNIHLYENGKLTLLISDTKKLYIAKAKFLNNSTIVFSLLSNQLYLFDLKEKKNLYIKQISQSKFSDFVLNEKRSEIIIADESGDLKNVKLINGEIIKTYKGYNLDNVFQVDWKNSIILTAGQDRRAVVYNNGNTYYKQVNFLIYSCGLSPSGKLAAFASDEDNNANIFNTYTKSKLHKLIGNSMTLTKILFINEKELFISSDDTKVNYYKLK